MNPAVVSLHNARKKHAAKNGAQYDQQSVRPGWERQSGCCVLGFRESPPGGALPGGWRCALVWRRLGVPFVPLGASSPWPAFVLHVSARSSCFREVFAVDGN